MKCKLPHILWIAFSVFLLNGCNNGQSAPVQKNSSSALNTKLLYTDNQFPQIGDPGMISLNAYRSDGFSCVDLKPNSTSEQQNREGQINFSKASSVSTIQKLLGIDATLAAQTTQAKIKASTLLSLLDNAADTSNSISLLYAAERHNTVKYTSNMEHNLNPTIVSILNSKALSNSQKALQIQQSCGDSFISGFTTGVMLTVKFKMDFNSTADRKKIDASTLAQTNIFNALVQISKEAKEKSVNGNLSISIVQLGGDGTSLSNYLDKHDLNITDCSLSNMENCLKLAQGMQEYSSGLDEQVDKNPQNAYIFGSPTYTRYKSLSYNMAYDDKFYTALSMQQATPNSYLDTLFSLQQLFNKLTNDIDKIHSIINYYDFTLNRKNRNLPIAQLQIGADKLEQLKQFILTGYDSSGTFKNYTPNNDNLNVACFFPSSSFSYESLGISIPELNKLGISSNDSIMNSRCGEYLALAMSQLKTATNGLIEFRPKSDFDYGGFYLDSVYGKNMIEVGGDLAKITNDKLYLVPNYLDEKGGFSLVSSGDDSSDEIGDSKFRVSFSGVNTYNARIKLSGSINNLTIKKFPNELAATENAGSSRFGVVKANYLVVAPLKRSDGCIPLDMEPNKYVCTGLAKMVAMPVNSNTTADYNAALLYSKYFQHLEILQPFKSYSISALSSALEQLGITSNQLSAQQFIDKSEACPYPNQLNIEVRNGIYRGSSCKSFADLKKYQVKRCDSNQVSGYVEDKNGKSSFECYPLKSEEEKQKLFNTMLAAVKRITNGSYGRMIPDGICPIRNFGTSDHCAEDLAAQLVKLKMSGCTGYNQVRIGVPTSGGDYYTTCSYNSIGRCQDDQINWFRYPGPDAVDRCT